MRPLADSSARHCGRLGRPEPAAAVVTRQHDSQWLRSDWETAAYAGFAEPPLVSKPNPLLVLGPVDVSCQV